MKTLAVVLTLLTSVLATAEEPQKLGLFVGAGYLGSPDTHGAAMGAGVRLAMGRHLALSFDLGYGVVGNAATVQDRWWLIPSVALVIPVGRVRFDIGAGVGLGTCSGYSDWRDFAEAPFMPTWAFQLAPAARGHVVASVKVRRNLELFARVDVASLLLDGNAIGFRDNNLQPGARDTMWVNLWLGFQFGLL